MRSKPFHDNIEIISASMALIFSQAYSGHGRPERFTIFKDFSFAKSGDNNKHDFLILYISIWKICKTQ